jgi:Ca2+-binding EF-hand superfamily protein
MSLAGGFKVGDRVSAAGRLGTVLGGPARAACIRLSVAVRFDDGRIVDERVANLELLVDVPPNDEESSPSPPPASIMDKQQMASQNMWGPPSQDLDCESPQNARVPEVRELAPPVGDVETLRPEVLEQAPNDAPDSPEYADERGPPPGANAQSAPGYSPEEAEAIIREKIYRNYQDLHSAFRDLDRSNNGYVSRADFFQAMGNILLNNGYSEDDVYDVADRFDLNNDGYLSFDEFVAVVEGDGVVQDENQGNLMDDPQLLSNVDKAIQKFKIIVDQRYSAVRQPFLAMDRERKGWLSPQNFAQGLVNHGLFLSPPELELAYSVFDKEGKGQITYTDFCAVMTERFQFGAHIARQMFR